MHSGGFTFAEIKLRKNEGVCVHYFGYPQLFQRWTTFVILCLLRLKEGLNLNKEFSPKRATSVL